MTDLLFYAAVTLIAFSPLIFFSLKGRHHHSWSVRGAEVYSEFIYSMGRKINQGHLTEVLYVCECGRARTKSLRGNWDLEELQCQS